MIKPFVPTSNMITVYQSIIKPYFDYYRIVWDDISDRLTDKLQKLQNRAVRVITGANYLMPINELLSKLGWSNLKREETIKKLSQCLIRRQTSFRVISGYRYIILWLQSGILLYRQLKQTTTRTALLTLGRKFRMPYQTI